MRRTTRPVIAVQARDLRPGDILAEGGVELTDCEERSQRRITWTFGGGGAVSWPRDAWVAIIEPALDGGSGVSS